MRKLTQAQLDLLATGVHLGHHPDDGQVSPYGSNPKTVSKLVEAGLLSVRKRRISKTITEYFLTEEGRDIAEPVRRKMLAEIKRRRFRVV